MGVKNFWHKRRVLVTGGSGFIGYALSVHLVRLGAFVSILDIHALPPYATNEERKKIFFKKGSVTSEKTVTTILKKRKIQTVFHLAAEAIVGRALENPAQALDTNVRGTWALLEAMRTLGGIDEMVVASSDKAYGSRAMLPYREDAPLDGENPYDVSKSAADLIAKSYAKTFDLPVAIARCGNVYGPGDMNWSRLIPDALRSLMRGTTLKLRSNGKYARDYVYIDDIVDAYCVLAENVRTKKLSGEAFNFGTREPLSVLDVIACIDRAAKKKVAYKILDTAHYEIQKQYLDSTKARRVLRWKPRVGRDIGFARTWTWYADFLTARL